MLGDSTPFHDIRWFEWAAIVGLAVSVFGLLLTYLQAKRAATAATAASEDATYARKELSTRQALILIPRLRTLALELDDAAASGDPIWVRRRLESWRWESGHLHGLMSRVEPLPTDLLKSIAGANNLAAIAAGRPSGDDEPIEFEKALKKIRETCGQLTLWAGASSAEIGAA